MESRWFRCLVLSLPLQGCAAFLPGLSGGFQIETRVSNAAAGDPSLAPRTLPATAMLEGSAQSPGLVTGALVPIGTVTLRVVSASGAVRVIVVRAGSLALEGSVGALPEAIVGGTLTVMEPAPVVHADVSATVVAPAPPVAWEVTGGEVVVPGGATMPVARGRVTVSIRVSGDAAMSGAIAVGPGVAVGAGVVAAGADGPELLAPGVTSGPIVTGVAAPVVAVGVPAGPVGVPAGPAEGAVVTATVTARVDVRQINLMGEVGTVAGGAITAVGCPAAPGLTVLDGSVRLATTSTARVGATTGRWMVSGGYVTLGSADGRRWRAQVDAGRLDVHAGASVQGRTRWDATGGELHVSVAVALGDGFANGIVLPAPPAVLSARTLAALDELVAVAPAQSPEAVRLQIAVDLVRARPASDTPTFYTLPMAGRSIVVAVDVSYSMSDPDPAADAYARARVRATKLDVARAELIKFLSALPGNVTVNVVAFSSTGQSLWTAPRVMDEAALHEAIRWVGRLGVVDETRPVEALRAAAAMPIDQIVMVTDGRPTYRETEAALLSFAGTLPAQHIRLDVVGVGADQDAPFIANLAAIAGGIARQN